MFMNTVPIHTILTHKNPDLDAIMSVLLLKKFGAAQFEGVSTAKVDFASAGDLPEDKTTEELEKEGIIAVDIGGGRFDNHPVNNRVDWRKKNNSATDLVALSLGILEHPEWKELIEYTRLQDSRGHHLHSKEAMHQMISLISIIVGFQILFPGSSANKLEKGMQIIECIPYYLPIRHRKKTYFERIVPAVEAYIKRKGMQVDALPPCYANISTWLTALRNDEVKSFPRNNLDDLVTFKAIILGAFERFGPDSPESEAVADLCLDAIFAREKEWFNAIQEIQEKGVVHRLNELEVVGVSSTNRLTTKAARYAFSPVLVVYQDPEKGGLSFMLSTKGPLNQRFMTNLTIKIRLAECALRKEPADYAHLANFGKVHGWFLHQSGKFLIRGSDKAPDFIPTILPFEVLMNIASREIIYYLGLSIDPNQFAIPPEIDQYFLEFSFKHFKDTFH